ncbi:MAG: hypothetical protein OEU32_16925 [Acidimicrobiia bacterium]|nr:hypothetical protein [Acidimicrobiia bacterium]
MPWCEPCDKFYNPNTVSGDGSCPSCGTKIDAPAVVVASNRIPWHFWLLAAAAGIYLGWRAVQGVVALLGLF